MWVTPEQIEKAKQMDLLTYLQSYEPGNLKKISHDTWCTKEHDSLKISNGKWHWFSRHIGGKTALDYLIKVKGISFVNAVEIITGYAAVLPPVYTGIEKPIEPKKLELPEYNTDIWNYVVEHGYRHYDEIVLPGECPEMVYLRIARCILKKGEYAYEE